MRGATACGNGVYVTVSETGPIAARAIDDLYRRHAGEVYRYAYAVLGHRADAEDVTQTTFLNAYRSLESGVRPRKPSNWLLTIASNLIKQRFRTESAKPRQSLLGEHAAHDDHEDTPTIGELMAALGAIPPLQRQAIVLREFEGRPYAEIADILGVTTSALETLLFRARRSLAEELDSQLTCSDAQHAVSRAVDGRLGRKERRRLRGHIAECPDCARFARLQQRNRRALRGLTLVPVPVLDWPFRGVEAQAAAALSLPTATAGLAAAGSGAGAATGVLGGSMALKAAALATAASVAAGVGVAGSADVGPNDVRKPPPRVEAVEAVEKPGKRLGQLAPRGVAVPGNGVALGRTGQGVKAKGKNGRAPGYAAAAEPAAGAPSNAGRAEPGQPLSPGRSAQAKAKDRGRAKTRATPPGRSEDARAATPSRGAPTQAKPAKPAKPQRASPLGRPTR